MRKILIGLSVVLGLIVTFSACDSEQPTYTGPNYIVFSDTLSVLPVQDNEEYFDVPVAATQPCDYDRTLGVEILDKRSNAIEGRHYTLESNTVVIKAGERVANVKVRGIYDNIEVSDSIGFVLRLVTEESTHWKLYGTETKVLLRKTCPFDIHAFEGWAVLTSTYLMNYTNDDKRLIRTEIDPKNENTVILKNYFYDGYDVKVKFKTNDRLNPLLKTDDQVFAATADAFGTIYGDGYLNLYQPSAYVSYYSTCEKFMVQYMTLYVPGMAAGSNVVGTFINIVEWISDDEAKKLQDQGY